MKRDVVYLLTPASLLRTGAGIEIFCLLLLTFVGAFTITGADFLGGAAAT